VAADAGYRRYLAPAAFLLVVTIAVVLIRSGIESGHGGGGRALPQLPTVTAPTVASTSATTTGAPRKQARKFWTVQAGDTFGVISGKTGVPMATLQQLNPTVKSTSLFIGEKLRIR
jgi:LysM repeat protein